MRVFSSGWGVDSTAVLILQIMGRIESYDHFIFANVGEDSENPDTIAYIKNVITPVAASRGISLVEVRAPGSSLYERLMGEQKSVVIPAYTRRSGVEWDEFGNCGRCSGTGLDWACPVCDMDEEAEETGEDEA